jgi:5-methylcytosine-specific restriction protein A
MPNYDSISAEDYKTALKSLPDWSREILVLQFQSPRHEITAARLARQLGYRHFIQGNQHYGATAHLVCKVLNVAEPPSNQWFEALSVAHKNNGWIWTMRPNLVEAIKQMGWSSDNLTQRIKTYLLTWNPNRWPWEDLAERSAETLAGKGIIASWSCGNTKSIQPGDRFFLMQVSKEPKGIIGSGWVTTAPHLRLHWDGDKAAAGKECLGVDGEWERLLNPPVDTPLGMQELKKGRLADFNWTPQSSGIRIPDEIATELEEKWAAHVGKTSMSVVTIDAELSAMEGAEKLALVRHRKREQSLRDAKVAEARKLGSGKLKCDVAKCCFDFEAVYGELGRDYAQVHHLKPLADRTKPSQTKLADLAIVCANCHAMIHRGGKCRSLDKLIP